MQILLPQVVKSMLFLKRICKKFSQSNGMPIYVDRTELYRISLAAKGNYWRKNCDHFPLTFHSTLYMNYR